MCRYRPLSITIIRLHVSSVPCCIIPYIPLPDPDSEESEPSKVLSAVRFGWNSVFSVDSRSNQQLSDADIERIIDRTRGGARAASGSGNSGDKSDKNGDNSGVKREETGDVQVVGAGMKILFIFLFVCLHLHIIDSLIVQR